MISYTIIGSADSKELADLENRCNRVKRAFPGVGFRIVAKVPQECEKYINDTCKMYGFKNRLNPLAFTKEGTLIGGYLDMIKELDTRFNPGAVPLDPEDLVTPELNMQISMQDFKNRHRLASLSDRINEEYQGHLKKGDFNFHLEKFEAADLGHSIIYIKNLPRLTPKLNLQQTEEIELDTLNDKEEEFNIAAAFKADFEEEEANEDSPGKAKKYDESTGSPSKKFTGTEITLAKDALTKAGSVQGGAPTPRDAAVDMPPVMELQDKEGSVKSITRKQSAELKDKSVLNADGTEKTVPIDQKPTQLAEALSTGKPASTENQKLGSNDHTKDHGPDYSQKDEAAKEIDQEAEARIKAEEEQRAAIYNLLLEIKPTLRTLKKWHVATLDNHYELCLHPEPLFSKHCILTKNGRIKYDVPLLKYKPYEEKVDKRVRISDFSNVDKLRVDSWSEKVRIEELANIEYTTMNSRFLDLRHPFTVHDLGIVDGLVKQLDSFSFYRVLPLGAKDHKPLFNQCVHLVAKSDLLHEVNSCMKGFIQVDELDLVKRLQDWTEVHYDGSLLHGLQSKMGLVSDKTIEDYRQNQIEMKRRREQKIRRIEEKRLRREARERELQEKLEAERKAAEEAAAKEREALKNPAKAAALRLEKEKAAAAAAAQAEQERLEKEKAAGEAQVVEGVEGQDMVIDAGAEDLDNQNLFESNIPQTEQKAEFVNKFGQYFYRFSRRSLTAADWSIPHRIYRRSGDELPEVLEEALEYLVLALEHEFPDLVGRL